MIQNMKKILVVDDELDILEVVKHILKNQYFSVETLSQWQKISNTIETFKPDLILLDVSLGGADGRDICSDLKHDPATKDIPIILFSAIYNLKGNLKGCEPDAVIPKPFDAKYLVQTIDSKLNEKSYVTSVL